MHAKADRLREKDALIEKLTGELAAEKKHGAALEKQLQGVTKHEKQQAAQVLEVLSSTMKRMHGEQLVAKRDAASAADEAMRIQAACTSHKRSVAELSGELKDKEN